MSSGFVILRFFASLEDALLLGLPRFLGRSTGLHNSGSELDEAFLTGRVSLRPFSKSDAEVRLMLVRWERLVVIMLGVPVAESLRSEPASLLESI